MVTNAVRDGMRSKGIGETLRALLDEAAARSARLSLDVRETHPAMRLCAPVGFRRGPGQAVRKRVGTVSFSTVHGEGSAEP